MKKLFLLAVLALGTLSINAQKNVYISTTSGTDVSKYVGQTVNVTIYRQVFNGWNTICLPFSMTSEEIDAAFGAGCKLETLTDVTYDNQNVTLNFSDVKKKGIEAGKPYLLYYPGENKSFTISLKNKELVNDYVPVVVNGFTFVGTKTHFDGAGQYGILARDNKESSFVAVDTKGTNGFYASRCYINAPANSPLTLAATHNNGATNINDVENKSVVSSEVYNLAGQKVNNAQKGINIVNGKKVLVK